MCSELGWPDEDACFEKEKKKQNKTGHPFTLSTTCSKKSDKSVPNNPTD